jgi:hypothetical protein
MAIQHERLSS